MIAKVALNSLAMKSGLTAQKPISIYFSLLPRSSAHRWSGVQSDAPNLIFPRPPRPASAYSYMAVGPSAGYAGKTPLSPVPWP